MPSLSHTPILTLIPVISTTSSLGLALTEYAVLAPFLYPERSPDLPSRSLQTWFRRFFRLTVPGVVAATAVSTIGGTLAWRSLGTVGTNAGKYRGVSSLLGWGAVFAVAHMVYVPNIAQVIKRMLDGPTDDSRDDLQAWLRIHTIRTLTTDIPAWLCFVVAMVKML